jgi:hypothetical protein
MTKIRLNLYLLSQDTNVGWDTFDSCVVAAKNEEDARMQSPSGGWSNSMFKDWCDSPSEVTVKLIGKAESGIESGVVIASFNAG